MRLSVSKGSFVRSWQLAQTSIKSTPTITALGCVKCCAEGDSVTLMSTDLKTSVTCLAQGAVISEEGEAILPARIVGELIKKLPDSQFTLSAEEGKGYIEAGRSRYTFVTYPVDDFPILPTSETAKPLCALPVGDMIRLLKEGTFSGSPSEEFPQYLSAASIKVDGAKIETATTDIRRLSVSSVLLEEKPDDAASIVLPIKGLKDLERLLGGMDDTEPLHISYDNSQAYFSVPGVEFTVRCIDITFPPYEKMISPDYSTWMTIDRGGLEGALDRASVMVRNYGWMVILDLEPGGELVVRGVAPDVGEAVEALDADIGGEKLRIIFNVRYFLDGLQVLGSDKAFITFCGPSGQINLLRPGDDTFRYLLMPITLQEGEAQSLGATSREDVM